MMGALLNLLKKRKMRAGMTSAATEDLDRKRGHGQDDPGAGEAAGRGNHANTGLMMCTEESELCLMLVGRSSAGKTKTGNTILGEKKFDSSACSTSFNKTCKKETVEWKGRKIVVVDTPSIFDTELTPEQVKQEVRSCISFSPLGPHCIVLVVRIGRYTEGEKKTIERIQDAFGDQAVRYMMIVFTRKDDLENESINDYIIRSRDLMGLIQKCGNRYCAFNNRASPEEREEQVTELLTMIESMVKENSGTRYTIEMYEKAEKIHLEKLEERKIQKRNPHKIEKEKLKQQFEEECKKIQEEAKIRQGKMNCYEKECTIEDCTSRCKQDKEAHYSQDSGPDSRGRRSTSGHSINGDSEGKNRPGKSESGITIPEEKRFKSTASSSSGNKTFREERVKEVQEINDIHEEETDKHIGTNAKLLPKKEATLPIEKQPQKMDSNTGYSTTIIQTEGDINTDPVVQQDPAASLDDDRLTQLDDDKQPLMSRSSSPVAEADPATVEPSSSPHTVQHPPPPTCAPQDSENPPLHFEGEEAGVQQELDKYDVRSLVSRMDVVSGCLPGMIAHHQSHVDTLSPLRGLPQSLDRFLDSQDKQQGSTSELTSEVRELVKELHRRNNIDEAMQVEQATMRDVLKAMHALLQSNQITVSNVSNVMHAASATNSSSPSDVHASPPGAQDNPTPMAKQD